MKRTVAKYLLAIVAGMTVFTVLRPVFMLIYMRYYSGIGFADILRVMQHGFPMDLSVSAYLSVIPSILLLVSCLCGPRRWLGLAERVYYMIVSVLLSGIFVLDLMLYSYWGFRLDSTPFFYFFSGPKSALASVTLPQCIGGVLGLSLVSALCYAVYYFVVIRYGYPQFSTVTAVRLRRLALSFFLLIALIVPMRGSFTVATMNLSHAYFSDNMRMNHAAVNPAFSLLYSLSLPDRYGSQFRFYQEPGMADAIVGELNEMYPEGASLKLIDCERPDIYLVVLESFSSHLLPCMGGDSIAMRLDSLAQEGVLFDRFYASSFRTDRGLAAILSAVPAQPTESVLKHVAKAERLPSIAAELAKNGYECSFYHGGDCTFANVLAYLRASGFSRIVQDKDFPLSERLSKWGAPDGAIMDKCISELRKQDAAGRKNPRFVVVQTLSSHEPYDVPYENPRFEEGPLRAFAYADSCLGAFVDSLRVAPGWDRTLVAIVPDHYGCWPADLTEMDDRHHIPVVFVGGALSRGGLRLSRLSQQTDLAATLLRQLEMPTDLFPFSRNAADTTSGGYAFFSERDAVRLVTDNGKATLTVENGDIKGDETIGKWCKAYLQSVFDYIDKI